MEIARADGRIDDREVAVSIEHLMETFSRLVAEALIERSLEWRAMGLACRPTQIS